jgi:hypothetical protein
MVKEIKGLEGELVEVCLEVGLMLKKEDFKCFNNRRFSSAASGE